jgi:hypothetical protein
VQPQLPKLGESPIDIKSPDPDADLQWLEQQRPGCLRKSD